jgi:hypothetical protein
MPAWYTLLSSFSHIARLLTALKVCINDGKAARCGGSTMTAGRQADRTALVTAAGRGQGRAHAVRLAAEGANMDATLRGYFSYTASKTALLGLMRAFA